jgi:hypothetical protein
MRRRDKILTRPAFRAVTPEAFKTKYEELALKYPVSGDLAQALSDTTVRHYLGDEWLYRYVDDKSPHRRNERYLQVDFDAPPQEKMKAIMRYLEFSETLLNLQNMEGFESVLDELSYGKIESACGELDVARMLAFHELKFSFVPPTRGTKQNYDFEIYYPDGFKVCAEAKAKCEATAPRAQSVRKTLQHARDQLPDDGLSVILVKVPENWISNIALAENINDIALDFLRQSAHIASVKYYTPVTIYSAKTTARWHAYREASNPKFPNRNWDMFRDETVPMNGFPSWWIRFYREFRVPE